MWNMKWENVRHVQNNVTIADNCWICWQFNSKHLLTVNNLGIILFNLKMLEFFLVFFLVDFEQVFYEIAFVWKSLFPFVVVVHETF